MMKKIKDERLMMQNLKNIRIAFTVQTLGIVAILVYIGITEDIREVFNHPLWLVLMITMVVLGWLSIRISVDVYDHTNAKKKPGPYYRIIILSGVVGTAIGLLAKFGPDKSSHMEAFKVGIVVFICFLSTFTFAYYLRKKRSENISE